MYSSPAVTWGQQGQQILAREDEPALDQAQAENILNEVGPRVVHIERFRHGSLQSQAGKSVGRKSEGGEIDRLIAPAHESGYVRQ